MENEVKILLFLSAFLIIVSILYWFTPSFTKRVIGENDPFEKKIFGNNLPFWQFLMLTTFIPAVVMVVVMLFNEISNREYLLIVPFNNNVLTWGIVVLLVYSSYGLGAHATSVSISHYMGKMKDTRAFKSAEFYHHAFSHFLSIVPAVVVFLLLAIWEIDHPLSNSMSLMGRSLLTLGGISMGVVLAFAIIEGRAKYYAIPLLSFSLLAFLFFVYDQGLDLSLYPLVWYLLVGFAVSLITIVSWRMKHGEIRETIGEFFHE